MRLKEPIPVTVLTGYLGAGKTTLLNQLLAQPHGYKCAIVINEFGAISIDHQLVVGADEEVLELNNGCLCCRVRGDLIRSLGDLLRRQKRFDYVLIETTGLADPGPIAHTFRNTELAEKLSLDGIVTVIDARHLEKELNDGPEPRAQIASADVILLNKTDLVTSAELSRMERLLQTMNPLAEVHRTQHSQIDVGRLLNIKARSLDALQMPARPPGPTAQGAHSHSPSSHDHDHDHDQNSEEDGHLEHSHNHNHDENHKHNKDHDHGHGEDPEAGDHGEHAHDESVKSIWLVEERPLDLVRTQEWLTEILQALGPNIYRSKGILQVHGQPKRVVFQGVQTMFDAKPDRFWHPKEKRQSQLVFIGKDLDEKLIREGLQRCVTDKND